MTARSQARVATNSAARYAKQLCAHATHMGAHADWTPPEGVVDFPQGGSCHLTAEPDVLILVAEAPTPGQLATIQSIVTANIRRFGQRQGLTVDWSV